MPTFSRLRSSWKVFPSQLIAQEERNDSLAELLTNLDELLLRTVLAFPNASRSGLDWRMTSLTCWAVAPPPDTWER